MYDIDVKNVKKANLFYYVFLAIGVVFAGILLAIILTSTFSQKALDSTTTSTSVDTNRHLDSDGDYLYSPIYTYEVNGKTYTCTSNASTSINPGEDNKTVYYDSKDPSKCMTEFSTSMNWMLVAFLILPGIFIVIGLVGISKTKKRVKAIEALNQSGKLIKNLPYHLEDSNITVNEHPLPIIVVDYKLPSGNTVRLCSEPRYDRKTSDEDGLVDMIIDETNPDNHFIDFEINRIGGNKPSDYFVDPNAPTNNQPLEQAPAQPAEPEQPAQSSEPTIPPAIKI